VNANTHLTQDAVAVYMTRRGCRFNGAPVQSGPLHAWHWPDGTWGIYNIQRGRWVKRGEQ
jgi:hypothetical protein